MSHYCPINEKDPECKVITPDDTFKSEDYAGPYSSHKECVDSNIMFKRCMPYKCEGGKCIQDKDGIYYSKSSCEVLCDLGDVSKTKTSMSPLKFSGPNALTANKKTYSDFQLQKNNE